MNSVSLVGRLVDNPKIRSTLSGHRVCEMRVAVKPKYDKEKVYFFNVSAWSALADLCCNYLVKGQRVAVVGELQSRMYEDKDGKKVNTVSVVAEHVEFLEKPKRTEQDSTPDEKPNEIEGFSDISDEEMPF